MFLFLTTTLILRTGLTFSQNRNSSFLKLYLTITKRQFFLLGLLRNLIFLSKHGIHSTLHRLHNMYTRYITTKHKSEIMLSVIFFIIINLRRCRPRILFLWAEILCQTSTITNHTTTANNTWAWYRTALWEKKNVIDNVLGSMGLDWTLELSASAQKVCGGSEREPECSFTRPLLQLYSAHRINILYTNNYFGFNIDRSLSKFKSLKKDLKCTIAKHRDFSCVSKKVRTSQKIKPNTF